MTSQELKSGFFLFFVVVALIAAAPLSDVSILRAGDKPEIIPLSQIKPGMKGVAYTIFAGDQIEPMDLQVIGILPNLLGPKQDIILVQMVGAKVEHTGVVAGMSGSPVYIQGKLAGALALKFGQFTKEAIGGVMPIEQMLEVHPETPVPSAENQAGAALDADTSAEQQSLAELGPPAQFPLPADWSQRIGSGSGAALVPIETPLVFSGVHPEVFAHFASLFAARGMIAAQGGTTGPQPDDADIKAGDMVSMVLMDGDIQFAASCTVTLITADRVYVCGHPLFDLGAVDMPLARGRVLTTLASDLDSVKIVNVGGTIGAVREDRTSAVMGVLGPAPKMIPMELTVATPNAERKAHYGLMNNPKITPLLVGIATLNALTGSTVYGEGTTLRLTGEIQIAGHSPVEIENMFAPTDVFVPDGMQVTASVQSLFSRIFTNPYENAKIERISLRVDSISERRSAIIENAWCDKSEVQPGEQVSVKVLLRPYRGAPFIQDVPIQIPAQAARGTSLRIQVSDSDQLNRMSRALTLGPAARLNGLEQLITLLNRERRNDRLYVTLLEPTTTLLVEDKELPNAPLSEINILDQRRSAGAGNALMLRESTAGEWSVPLNRVVTGTYSLNVLVK